MAADQSNLTIVAEYTWLQKLNVQVHNHAVQFQQPFQDVVDSILISQVNQTYLENIRRYLQEIIMPDLVFGR